MPRTWVIGILLILYGLVHLFGFLTSWNLIDVPGISRTPTVFADDIPVGVLRDLGALWLLGLVAFSIAGYGAIQGRHWWKGLTLISTVISLIVMAFWIHEVWLGILLNAIIIASIIRSWRQPLDEEAGSAPAF